MLDKFCRAPAPATAPNRAKFGKKCGATGSKDMKAFKARQRIPFGGSVPPRALFPDRKTTSKKHVKSVKNETNKREKTSKKSHPKIKKIAKKHKKTPTKCDKKYRKNQPESAKIRQKKTRTKYQKIEKKMLFYVFFTTAGGIWGAS